MTIVINFFAGPGSGKSTTAAALYSEMKLQGYSVELVREYVKNWAWEGKVPNKYDQVYLFGKQARAEYSLYKKVDYIITDSPILQSGFYEYINLKRELTYPSVVNFLQMAKEDGIVHINIFLKRNKEYVEKGRFQTEQQVIKLDEEMKQWLTNKQIDFIELNCLDKDRVDSMINIIRKDKE